MPAVNTFERIEKKFMMTKAQYEAFMAMTAQELVIDEYGYHTICNIYYDTEHDDLIGRSIEKPLYKEKLRLRSYGVPGSDDTVFLEIKKKFQGIVYKRRVALSLEEAKAYLEHGIIPEKDGQIMHEIDYFIRFYHPMPKKFIAYDRVAMYGVRDPQLRLTIDSRIRSRDDALSLEQGSSGRLILPEDHYLMEIKVPRAIPMWLVHTLEKLAIYPVSFSKYGEAYKQKIKKEQRCVKC